MMVTTHQFCCYTLYILPLAVRSVILTFTTVVTTEDASCSQPPEAVKLINFALTCFPSVHPFASEEEFKAAVDTVRKFQEGVGKELHQKLLQRAKTKRNWVCN